VSRVAGVRKMKGVPGDGAPGTPAIGSPGRSQGSLTSHVRTSDQRDSSERAKGTGIVCDVGERFRISTLGDLREMVQSLGKFFR
jgi:hypothetical protein